MCKLTAVDGYTRFGTSVKIGKGAIRATDKLQQKKVDDGADFAGDFIINLTDRLQKISDCHPEWVV